MQIVGRLIKKTAEIGYKRNLNKGLTFDYQINTLQNLLERAKKTNFGKSHHFSSILDEEDPISGYQKSVPMMEYEKFYQTWLHRSIDGVKDNTWPGQIRYFALS